MVSMLEKEGFEIVVASGSGQPLVGSSTTLEPDLKTADVKMGEYVGVILPCMVAGRLIDSPPVDPGTVKIVKRALAEGKPVAAQCGSINVLAKAGVLIGKRYTYMTVPFKFFGDARFKGAIRSKGLVVKDGNIITSRICPRERGYFGETEDGTAKLTQALIAELKKK